MFQNTGESKTQLSDLGEFGLIDHLTRHFAIQHSSTIKSIGDDAAVLQHKDPIVVTTDLLVEGIHFDLSYVPLKHLGYKSVMVNLSDVYAMNAKATQITVSISCSNRFTVEALEELYAGIQLAAQNYQVDVVGGDTTSAIKGLTLSITAIGTAAKEKITYRSGAKPNDLLVVSGDLGSAFMGLKVLEREKEVFKVNPNNQPDLEKYTYLVERQLKPEARKDIPELLDTLGVVPTAMIDISDGLSSEVMHICKQSKVGAFIYEDKLPMDQALISACEEFELDSTTVVLNGGEDYELLFSIDQKDYDNIKGNPNLTVIGHVSEASEGIHLVTRANAKLPIKAMGWNSME